jgi:hypothetical protein
MSLGTGVALEPMDCPQHFDRPANDLLDPIASFAPAVVARIQPEMAHPGQPRSGRFIEHELDPISVHDIGGVDVDRQEQPFRIDQNMAFAPNQFLGAIVAACSSHAGGLHRLTIDTAGAGLGIATQRDSELFPQEGMDPLQRAVSSPFSQVIIDTLPRWPVAGKQPPGTAGAQHIEQRIHDCA